MQVNAISASNPSFRATDEDRIFAKLDDSTLRNIAWNKASVDVNDKRHNKLDKAMFLSLPVIGGLSTLAYGIKPDIPVQKIRAAKFGRAGKIAGAWTLALGAVTALGGIKNIVENNVKAIKKFDNEHPMLTTIASLAVAFAAIGVTNKLNDKIFNKIIIKNGKNILEDASKMTKLDNILNTNKFINKSAQYLEKVPPALKDIGRIVLGYLPWIAFGTQIAHIWGHNSVKVNQAEKNYNELKTAQEIIREELIDEKINQELARKA
jgi:hypothetical protein